MMEQRTEFLKKSNTGALKDLEKECLIQNAKFKHWECNRNLMDITHNKQALYMHCLPADISGVNCGEGEVSADVFDQYRISTYMQAGFKPFIISALMFLSRVKDPADALGRIVNKSNKLHY